MFRKNKIQEEEYDVITENQKYHYKVLHSVTFQVSKNPFKPERYDEQPVMSKIINEQASQGYRLISMTTRYISHSRIEAILVFEKDLTQ